MLKSLLAYNSRVSDCRTTRPVFLELSAWPTLNFDGDPGTCPFDTKRQGKPESKLISKEVKENKKNIEFINKEEVHYSLLNYVCSKFARFFFLFFFFGEVRAISLFRIDRLKK